MVFDTLKVMEIQGGMAHLSTIFCFILRGGF